MSEIDEPWGAETQPNPGFPPPAPGPSAVAPPPSDPSAPPFEAPPGDHDQAPSASGGETAKRPRRRRRWIILGLAAGLALIALGVTMFSSSYSNQSQKLRAARHQIGVERASAASLQKSNTALGDRLAILSMRFHRLQEDIGTSVGSLEHPSFVLWNSCGGSNGCPIAPGHEYIGAVPDTFTYEVTLRATAPMSVYILSIDDFICHETKLCPWHAAASWVNTKDVAAERFHLAEGCAGYIAVFSSSAAGRFFPNIRVIRSNVHHPTGACRS